MNNLRCGDSAADFCAPALPLHAPRAGQGAASVQSLELRSFNAWSAPRTAVVSDWLLSSTRGYTKRANSANALQAPSAWNVPLQESIEDRYHYRVSTRRVQGRATS